MVAYERADPIGALLRVMPKVVVTGSCGLIGSEVSRFFARERFQIHGIDDNHRAVFFGPEGDTSWVTGALAPGNPRLPARLAGYPRSRGRAGLVRRGPPGLDYPHRRAAFARPGGRHSFSRFRSECARNAASSGSRPAILPRVAVHPHVDEQSLWGPAQRHRACKSSTRAWTTPIRRSRTALPRISRSIRASIR